MLHTSEAQVPSRVAFACALVREPRRRSCPGMRIGICMNMHAYKRAYASRAGPLGDACECARPDLGWLCPGCVPV